jgi:septal ring factor EnvC (AmiA/AmiB activator)
MNSKERDELLARLDERTENSQKKLEEVHNYCMALDQRVQNNTSSIARNRWHDWAIKGAIASICGILIKVIFY